MKRFYTLLIALCAILGLHAEQMPEGYYDRIVGLCDSTLKFTLRDIIRKHTVMSYGTGSWTVFYYADRDEDGYCMDMYCDDWRKFTTPGAVVSGCNVEHSFAKSWWGGSENDAYQDCYHLNPSNSNANSARSNFPLGDEQIQMKGTVSLYKTAGSLKIWTVTHDSLHESFHFFEPKDEYKGDFARAYFYMATCYGRSWNGQRPDLGKTGKKNYIGWRIDNKDVGSRYGMQNDNYLEFQPWLAEVLLRWNRQDPVSPKELHRMDAVSDYQHNRNPFIDYPDLAEYIWGNKKGEAYQFPSATDNTILRSDDTPSVTKVMVDGHLYIRLQDKLYTTDGLLVQ